MGLIDTLSTGPPGSFRPKRRRGCLARVGGWAVSRRSDLEPAERFGSRERRADGQGFSLALEFVPDLVRALDLAARKLGLAVTRPDTRGT